MEPLAQEFPDAVDNSGGISRPALSRLIQAAEEPSAILKKIEQIVHPLVGKAKQEWLAWAIPRSWLIVFDIPLLLEGIRAEPSRKKQFDAIVVVMCHEDVQRRRCLARPGMTESKLNMILQKQMPMNERRAYADFIIDTSLDGLDETASICAGRAQTSAVIGQLIKRHKWPICVMPAADNASEIVHPSMISSTASIAVITFDLDDTLYPLHPSITKAADAFLGVLERRAPLAHARWRGDRKLLIDSYNAVKKKYPLLEHDFSQIRRLGTQHFVLESGYQDAESIALEALAAFLPERGAVDDHLFDDVLPVLASLRKRGFKLGSITNGNASLKFAPRLRAALDFEINPEDVGASKPDPSPFLAAAHIAGVSDVRSLLHVGDSVDTDVLGAKPLGIQAVLMQRPGLPNTNEQTADKVALADATIKSLWELEPLLNDIKVTPLAASSL